MADTSNTRRTESARRRAIENRDKLLEQVQDLEERLDTERWTPGDEKWKQAEQLVIMFDYQRSLDKLESLIVARMFELGRMNMSRTGASQEFLMMIIMLIPNVTGYKLRRHIGHALKARSQAIRTALDQYNAAAAKLPRTLGKSQLKWDEVVEYSFLADFELLRDTRDDVSKKLWSKPAARQAMDQYFKIERAREEIERLNIEIRRLATYMVDEHAFLIKKEMEVQEENPQLAHQIKLHRLEKGRFNKLHVQRFQVLSKLQGFTGTLEPGVGKMTVAKDDAAMDVDESDVDGGVGEEESEEDEEEDEAALTSAMLNLVLLATDEAQDQGVVIA